MRYTRILNGIERLMKARSYDPKKTYYNIERPKPEESEDTKIRKSINSIILNMMQTKKGRVEIEVYLNNLYPKYQEYILKMISHHFAKINLEQAKENKNIEISDGDER